MAVRILLADDHQLVREGLRTMLQDEPGLEIIGEAEDGQRCVELAMELQPDLIIMDVTMPRLNGIEATRQIHAKHNHVRILAVSMHPERHFVVEMLSAGASGYLFKDSRLQELLTAIETVMRGEAYLSSKVTGGLLHDCITRRDKIHRLADHQRRRFLAAHHSGRERPCDAEILHSFRIDLIERGVARGAVVAAGKRPLAIIRWRGLICCRFMRQQRCSA